MYQVRIHGMGGQGVVSTAHLLGKAAMYSGLWANSLPFFTTAQRGGKVIAYTRIDSERIDQHCYIYEPDLLVLFSKSLLDDVEVLSGLKLKTKLIVSGIQKDEKICKSLNNSIYFLEADELAREILGAPTTSTVMAGAILKIIEKVNFQSLKRAIEDSFPKNYIHKNILAAEAGYDNCLEMANESETK